MTHPTILEPDRVLTLVETTMWESEGPHRSGGPVGAWLRAWPSGHVHYSEDWLARTDGRFDTACCRTRIFWPQTDWPKAKVCRQCAAIFRSLAHRASAKSKEAPTKSRACGAPSEMRTDLAAGMATDGPSPLRPERGRFIEPPLHG